MPGFSLTILLLPREDEAGVPLASDILSLLDKKVDVPGWKWASSTVRDVDPASMSAVDIQFVDTSVAKQPIIRFPDNQRFINALVRACNALIEAEPEITRMDVTAGDGDCGLTLKAGAEGKCLYS